MSVIGYTVYPATRERRSATIGLVIIPMPAATMAELDELITHLQQIRAEMDLLPDGGHYLL